MDADMILAAVKLQLACGQRPGQASCKAKRKWRGGGALCDGLVIPRGVGARAPYAEYGRNICLRNEMVVVAVEMMEKGEEVVLV